MPYTRAEQNMRKWERECIYAEKSVRDAKRQVVFAEARASECNKKYWEWHHKALAENMKRMEELR